MTDKTRRTHRPVLDESLPTKSEDATATPGYEGAAKPSGRTAGTPAGGTGPTKPPADHRDPAPSEDPLPDMQAASKPVADQPESGYVRLRVRVADGRMRVLESHLVEGPLSAERMLAGSHAYEVLLDGELLHAGALPDLGVQRSFPDPAATTGPRSGHHLTDRRSLEFYVRIPAVRVTSDSIGRLEVQLHALRGSIRPDVDQRVPLASGHAEELSTVATLHGLPTSALPEAITARGGRTPSQ